MMKKLMLLLSVMITSTTFASDDPFVNKNSIMFQQASSADANHSNQTQVNFFDSSAQHQNVIEKSNEINNVAQQSDVANSFEKPQQLSKNQADDLDTTNEAEVTNTTENAD